MAGGITAYAVTIVALAALVFGAGDAALWLVVATATLALHCVVAGTVAPLLLAAAALAWFAAHAAGLRAVALHPALADTTVTVTGRVVGGVRRDALASRFTLAVDDPTLPPRLHATWPAASGAGDGFAAEPPLAGDCWRLRLRLRPLAHRDNPGGFDRRAWSMRRGVGARAVVVHGRHNRRCGASAFAAAAWRRAIGAQIHDAVARADAAAVLRALSIGERASMTPETRALLARTGTAHLVAISGLHVGTVAALGFLLGRALPRPGGAPPGMLPLLAALLPAALYVALSGFAVPARRALLMFGLVAVPRVFHRPTQPIRVLALAAAFVAITAPAWVIDASFVFSFAAVTVLVLLFAAIRHDRPVRRPARRRLRLAVRVQVTLGVCLMPVTAHAFGFFSVLSLPANLLAVPFFALLVVPLALAAAVLSLAWPTAATPLWRLDGTLVALALDALATLDALPASVLPARLPSVTATALACLSLTALALARGAPGRWLGASAWIAMLLSRAPPPPPHCAELAALDVGHGTSIVVRDPRGTSLYDTGPGWHGGGSAAPSTLLPFLHRAGIDALRLVVLSHDDADHTGGAAEVAAHNPVARWLTGAGIDAPAAASRCRAGQRWHAAGVSYGVVWPVGIATARLADNDTSCVLRVATGRSRMLITGDVEALAERELVAMRAVRADALTLPHHGSATSSSAPFVAAAEATLALASADPDGRWPLPDAAVVERWRGAGADVVTTRGGAVGLRACRGRAVRLQDPDPWAESRGLLW